jgi:hypothetical protein
VQPATGEVVQVPLRTVGEHPHIPLLQPAALGLHISGELDLSVRPHRAHPKVPLDLEHRAAYLDVDPTPIPHGRLQHDLGQLVLVQLQRRRQQQRVQIRLDIRLGPAGPAVRQPTDESAEIDLPGDHGGRSYALCTAR